MATVKLTFSLDEDTVAQLDWTASRLRRPKSQVVREAIREYAARADRLSDAERVRLLGILDEALERIPSRPAAEVDSELASLRSQRRSGGRLRPGATELDESSGS